MTQTLPKTVDDISALDEAMTRPTPGLVEMMDRLIFREDSDASVILEEQLEKEGVTILSGKKAVKFQNPFMFKIIYSQG